MRFMGRSSLAVALGFTGIVALATSGAAAGHHGKGGHSVHGSANHWDGDGGDGSFTSADFSGIYVTSFQGNVGGGTWVTGNGLLTATPTDAANGTISGSETVNDSAGNFCPGTVSGTYTVAGDGTGGLNVTFTAGVGAVGTCTPPPETAAIVIVSSKHISVVQTNTGMAVLGNLHAQGQPEGGDEGGD
jgi:hypothetical protein